MGFNFPEGNHVLVNNLSFRDGGNNIGYFVESYSNSWDYFPFLASHYSTLNGVKFIESFNFYRLHIEGKDFISLDDSDIKGERDVFGNIPFSVFLRPSLFSVLRDIGVELGYPYYGKAPDIGALEFAPVMFMNLEVVE